MQLAVFHRPVVTIYDRKEMTKITDAGLQSTIADEGLYGTVCRVLPEEADFDDGWLRILTHYGYAGFVHREDVTFWNEEDLSVWMEKGRQGRLALVDTVSLDILSIPKVQGVCFQSLVGGAVVEIVPEEEGIADQHPGWCRVRLLDGQEGYARSQHLCPKRFSEEWLLRDPKPILEELSQVADKRKTTLGGQQGFSLQAMLDQWFDGDEVAFREKLVSEAQKYMGIQYRWGGRSFRGIDCSGLVSISYMRCGILIYRDASIVEGWPICRLDVAPEAVDNTAESTVCHTEKDRKTVEELPGKHIVTGKVIGSIDLAKIKKGDALYFPGHIAMYIGDGQYIHSTARIGSGGVVVNSLCPEDPDFRQDLLDCLYAVGGVRIL